jgi:hypothetical protein
MDKLVIGKTIMIPCMRAGLCAYESPKETVLVTQEVLAACADTAHGIPVVIYHQEVNSENVEEVVVGRVADLHHDAESGNWDAHFVVDSQEAVDLLKKGWGVSTSYAVMEKASGGTLNAVPYDYEVAKLQYRHLAIVEHPRYEMAKNPVFYNSKEDGCGVVADVATMKDSHPKATEKSPMIGVIKRLWKVAREEVKMNEGEELYAEVDGKEVKLSSITGDLDKMHEVEAAEKDAKEKKEQLNRKKLNGEDEIEYNGEKMTVNELVKRHGDMKSAFEKKNAEAGEGKETPAEEKKEEGDKKKENEDKPEEKKEEKKDNAADEAAAALAAKEKAETEARHATLQNAAASGEQAAETHLSLRERTELGRARYGSAK